jgi:hypothetical protein
MDQKGIFVLGVKLIGVYCLALAIEFVFHIFPWEFVRVEQSADSAAVYKFSPWISLMIPIVLTLLGRYLMTDGRHVHELVLLSNDDIGIGKTECLFTLGLALYGVYVLAGLIPMTINIVWKIVIVLCTPSYIDTEVELEGIKSDLLPTLVMISVGFICFYHGRYFTRIAFRESLNSEL